MKDMSFKNIIFDLDGTIIDSMPVWEKTTMEFMERQKVELPKDFDDNIKTMSLKKGTEYISQILGGKMTAEEVMEVYIDMVQDKYEHHIPLKEGAYEFLNKMYENGVRMSILTASEMKYIMPALKRLDVKKFFENVYTCSMLELGKDSPEVYVKAADVFGYDKKDTFVFEDALHAALSAKAAGFKVCGVYDKAEEETAELKKAADIYIKSYIELM